MKPLDLPDPRRKILDLTRRDLTSLATVEVPQALIQGRIKNPGSMQLKEHLGRLRTATHLDSLGVRIIVATSAQCYRVIEQIHRRFEHLESEYDDYIGAPKPNGYRSLHTVVLTLDGHPLEIQVRTQGMHLVAELGAAAHHVYKRG